MNWGVAFGLGGLLMAFFATVILWLLALCWIEERFGLHTSLAAFVISLAVFVSALAGAATA